jgi:hypothetical protein
MNNSNDGRNFRVEEDALGNVEVPIDHLWGAQTERSHRNFPIGVERYRWGRPVIRASQQEANESNHRHKKGWHVSRLFAFIRLEVNLLRADGVMAKDIPQEGHSVTKTI